MREIKFRVWDKFDSVMRDTTWLEQNNFALGVDGRMVVWQNDGLVLRDHNMFPMQYTGLHDKNGKEIYEGDIINFDNHGERTGQIMWDDYCAAYKIINIINPYQGCLEQGLHKGLDYLDVIGNIYENSELINL